MRRTQITGIAAAAVVLVLTGALLLQQQGAETPATVSKSADGGLPTATPSPVAKTAAAQPDATPTQAPAPAPAPAPKQGSPSPTVPAPGEANDVRVVEPGTPGSGSVSLPLPESKPQAVLVSLPLPDTSHAVGSIVDGFPTRVIPAAPHSAVATSSVATEGSRLQAALTAQTSLTVVEVLDFYRSSLAELGLYDTPAPALDGSSALSFTRGSNTITLSATAVDGGCRYVVFGTFTAAT
ncbi:hypothetical protein QMG61_08210 [Cryobacterium sp. PH31-AA6]|uniref:hypothetical protein n=1 Tax=Cryobacterium sp. PH31-AA6 TaxID=3046205 RepID=UPI0024B9EE2B|nr:hypothetical protein [Cryobacterium sp. PH31-AA6]MDJ0323746.1 hypothetical protein [Cryobacterium sp. PH31-AA6]